MIEFVSASQCKQKVSPKNHFTSSLDEILPAILNISLVYKRGGVLVYNQRQAKMIERNTVNLNSQNTSKSKHTGLLVSCDRAVLAPSGTLSTIAAVSCDGPPILMRRPPARSCRFAKRFRKGTLSDVLHEMALQHQFETDRNTVCQPRTSFYPLRQKESLFSLRLSSQKGCLLTKFVDRRHLNGESPETPAHMRDRETLHGRCISFQSQSKLDRGLRGGQGRRNKFSCVRILRRS